MIGLCCASLVNQPAEAQLLLNEKLPLMIDMYQQGILMANDFNNILGMWISNIQGLPGSQNSVRFS